MTVEGRDNKTLLAKSVLVNYDQVGDHVLCVVAYRRHIQLDGGTPEEDIMGIARKRHVEVWRDFDVLADAFMSVWDIKRAEAYKGRLIGWGFSLQDAEDILQAIAEYTYAEFARWRPWDAGFHTWAWQVGRWKQRAYLEERKRQDISFDSVELDGDSTETDDDYVDTQFSGKVSPKDFSILLDAIACSESVESPSVTIIHKLIAHLREGNDYKAKTMADVLEHALELGDAFAGFSSQLFLEACGLTRSQMNYRIAQSRLKEIAEEVRNEVSNEVSIL